MRIRVWSFAIFARVLVLVRGGRAKCEGNCSRGGLMQNRWIFGHSFGFFAQIWSKTLETLRRRWRVISRVIIYFQPLRWWQSGSFWDAVGWFLEEPLKKAMGSPVTWARYFLTKIRVSFAQGLRVMFHTFFVSSCNEEWYCLYVRLHYYICMSLPGRMHCI